MYTNIEIMPKRRDKKYPTANRAFMESLNTDVDIKELSKGVLYKIIKSGDGERIPLLSSIVSVHYRGTLYNGVEFDSTYGNDYPETFHLREVVEGWQIALLCMAIGDKWKIYIPSELGYGDRKSNDIPGGSVLIFEIELVAIS